MLSGSIFFVPENADGNKRTGRVTLFAAESRYQAEKVTLFLMFEEGQRAILQDDQLS